VPNDCACICTRYLNISLYYIKFMKIQWDFKLHILSTICASRVELFAHAVSEASSHEYLREMRLLMNRPTNRPSKTLHKFPGIWKLRNTCKLNRRTQMKLHFAILGASEHTYIKSCSHEVAKHKSRVMCQFLLPLATTLREMVTQSVRMGNAHAGSLRIRRRQYTNPMSKFVSPKAFQSNKSAKNL
jgi:hypothetical protein